MIVLFILLLGLSALLAASEVALFSLGRATRTRLAEGTRKVDRIITKLLEKPRDLLVTIVVSNELTNLTISVVGASIVAHLASGSSLAQQTLITELTVLPLLVMFGEITPKVLAAREPEATARWVARPFEVIKSLVTPVRIGLGFLADQLVKRLGAPPELSRPVIAESEFRAMIDVGHREGVVEAQEHTLIHNVLDFGDTVVGDIMSPIGTILSLPQGLPVEDAIRRVQARPHSRIPLWEGTPSHITGMVFAKELLAIRWGVSPPLPLSALKRPVLTCGPGRLADELLAEFRREHLHMAIVVDDAGQALGLVTMEDLLEELVGPIFDNEAAPDHD